MAAQNAQVSSFGKIYYRFLALANAGVDSKQVSTSRQIYAGASTSGIAPASGTQQVSTMRKLYAVPQQKIIVVQQPLAITNVSANPTTGVDKVTVIIFTAGVTGGVPFTTGDKYHYQWTWTNSAGGPGDSSGGRSPNITFPFPGTWSGVLEVIDSLGTFGIASVDEAQANIPPVVITGATVIQITGVPASGVVGGSNSYNFAISGTSFNAAGHGISSQTLYVFESSNPTGPWTSIGTVLTGTVANGNLGQFTFNVTITQAGTTYYEVSDTNPPS